MRVLPRYSIQIVWPLQQVGNGGCYAAIMLDKSIIKISQPKEGSHFDDGTKVHLHNYLDLIFVRADANCSNHKLKK
jgi:hypothetical protein